MDVLLADEIIRFCSNMASKPYAHAKMSLAHTGAFKEK
jgi:hypothetical protein